LVDLRRAAQNMVIVDDAIGAGQPPALFLGIFVKSGDGNLVRFVVRRWHPDLNEVPPGTAVVPLSTAASLGHLAIINLLLDSGASIDGRDPTYGLTALMTAAAAGHEEICRELVRREASLEFHDSVGYTALMFAAEGGYTEIVRFFLEHGAAVSTKSKEGFTALDYAIKHGHSGIAEMITKAANCHAVKCTP
jgi:ankyrin repeat protein